MARVIRHDLIKWDEQCLQCKLSLFCVTGNEVDLLECSTCSGARLMSVFGYTSELTDYEIREDLLACPAAVYSVVGTYYPGTGAYRDAEGRLVCAECRERKIL